MDIENLKIRRAVADDISLIRDLIKCLALYEKRPQDMTATQEQLSCWLFERKIAVVLIAEYNKDAVGYALYYPVFGSFSAAGRVHLEDIFIKEEFRGHGAGRYFLARIAEAVLADGYTEMEWNCLDWNEPSIAFYQGLDAEEETGRRYFGFGKSRLESLAASVKRLPLK